MGNLPEFWQMPEIRANAQNSGTGGVSDHNFRQKTTTTTKTMFYVSLYNLTDSSKHYKRLICVSQNQKSASINVLKYLQTKLKKI